MKSVPETAPEASKYQDQAEHVPLWRALAEFTSDDLDEGLKSNAAIIKKAKTTYSLTYALFEATSLMAGLTIIFCLGILLIVGQPNWQGWLLILLLIMILLTAAPLVWRHVRQYGWQRPDAPLKLSHPTDQYFEEFLAKLQKVAGPRVYYFSRFRKRQVYLQRQQFFGKMRYFLMSEDSGERSVVMQFRSPFSVSADIFLVRADVDAMLAKRKTPRKTGSGTTAKYPYIKAILSVLSNDKASRVDLTDQDKANAAIRKMLVDWFDQDRGKDADGPRTDYPLINEYAENIYVILKNFSRS